MDELIKNLINRAHHDVGQYCTEKCKAKCCREGHFILHSKNEASLMTKNNIKKYSDIGIIKEREDHQFEFDFTKHSCPLLSKELLCTIYKDANRFSLCKNFPIFLRYRSVFLASFCPAVTNGFFDSYVKELENLGCKIYIQ